MQVLTPPEYNALQPVVTIKQINDIASPLVQARIHTLALLLTACVCFL